MSLRADARPIALLLMGPTAVGKTDVAMEVAGRVPCEIVSVDSAMIYRGMDIGTAKPSQALRRVHPHALVDILDPDQRYSAARFRDDALREMARIHRAGRVPLLVGGTMLYFRALTEGLSRLPEADPAIRAELAEEARRLGWPALHERLAAIDPQSAARIHPNDPQRIQRALEVHRLTGRPLSTLQGGARAQDGGFRFERFALLPRDRAGLHRRIGERFQAMLEQGLVREVEALVRRHDLTAEHPSMRAVGYRQVWRFLRGDVSAEALPGSGAAATRQLAKRQLTWLRGDPSLRRFAADAVGSAAVADALCACVAGGRPRREMQLESR